MKNRISNIKEYFSQYDQSLNNAEAYWSEIGKTFVWKKPFTKVMTGDFHQANMKWFEDGELNITESCLDRHAKNTPDKIAIHYEANDPSKPTVTYTYKELLDRVCQFANVLKDQGVNKGDTVCFYMSMVPELMIGVLATARIGAVHSVVFGGFSAQALKDRIKNMQSKIVITNDEAYRGEKTIPLKEVTDEAVKDCDFVKTILVLEHTKGKIQFNDKKDKWLAPLLDRASKNFEAEKMKAEDPLFILYTSGSTGSPKGILHTIAGYMAWTSESFKQVFGVKDNDIYWCSADIGWITGHSYITYGPLLNGATQVLFEGIPTFPDAGRFWKIIEKYKVTHFYTAPTAIRALMPHEEFVDESNLSSLKVLGTVGEPINEEAWHWYDEKIGKGKCPIVDTWWQTETGGIMISPLAHVTKCIPSHATFPLPGVEPILVDSEGKEILGNPAEGNLCIKKPWPGVARNVYGDFDRFMQTYFTTYKGLYFTGDGARRDKDGNYRITGRVDDVINVSGHRIGTAEVEDAINEHNLIVESAVVGFPHDIKGQGIIAFVTFQKQDKKEKEELLKELNDLITKMIGPIAKLDKLVIVPGLPKTRSGKIMRRILRKLATNEWDQLGDTSTLLNPEVVDIIKQQL